MHELACPSCNAPAQYDLKDYLFMCPFCSATFHFHLETGQKELFTDHYIVPNTADPALIKAHVIEWIRRTHHQSQNVEKEFFIVDISGFSIPFWIISVEAHTAWKGLVRRQANTYRDIAASQAYLTESGQFSRGYRWAISARRNICETWGMNKLHEPREQIDVGWDGFPLDSTFSRGRLSETLGTRSTATGEREEVNAYDIREAFEFKYSNGLPILNIQVDEKEALRRAKWHIEGYHHKLSQLNLDILLDNRTETEIAGIQLIHLPFWSARYVYHPKSLLKYFHKPKEKNVVLDGFASGVIKAELAIVHRDKLFINSIIAACGGLLMIALGIFWHSSFFFVSVFAFIVAIISAYIAQARAEAARVDKLSKRQEKDKMIYHKNNEEDVDDEESPLMGSTAS